MLDVGRRRHVARRGAAEVQLDAGLEAPVQRRFVDRHGARVAATDGVSIWQIGAAADAQTALINCHFGTGMLYRAVFENRVAPLSERGRTALAEALSGEAGAPNVEGVLDALARPWIEMDRTAAAPTSTGPTCPSSARCN